MHKMPYDIGVGIPILDAITPDRILIADSPLRLGGQPRWVNHQEIKDKFSFLYRENIFIPQGLPVPRGEDDPDLKFIRGRIQERLQNPLNDSLVICFINEDVGYGVFTNKFIEAGTIIGIYAGTIDLFTRNREYALTCSADPLRLSVDARNIGGITRFILHLPYSFSSIDNAIRSKTHSIDSLKRILAANGEWVIPKDGKQFEHGYQTCLPKIIDRFLGEIFKSTSEKQREMETKKFLNNISNLATANLSILPMSFNGIFINYFSACCDIFPGEQLGFSYGLGYWGTKGIAPRYFDKDGKIIPLPLQGYLSSSEHGSARILNYALSSDNQLNTTERNSVSREIAYQINQFRKS